MHKYTFADVPKEMTENDVALYNLKKADETLNLNFFVASASGWFNVHTDKTYQDLEKLLRENNFNTYIFPKPTNNKTLLRSPSNAILDDIRYECIFSCRPKEYALAELLETWKSYDESFENLKYTGSIHIKNKDMSDIDVNKKDLKIYTSNEKSILYDISNNKKLIRVEKLSVQKVWDDLRVEITRQFKKEPIMSMISMLEDGSPVFVYSIDNNIVSDMGLSIGYDNKGRKIYNLVQFAQ